MKKSITLVLAVVFSLLMVASLAACANKEGKLPSTPFEKVRFAFDGVQRSFSDSASNAAPGRGGSKIYGMSKDEALAVIAGIYTDGDRQGDKEAEISYDQPPMQQFRFLKAIFENIGENYQFGTKYYDVISGNMFFDMDTGIKYGPSERTTDKMYAYDINFAISIELKENDLIYAEVSFEIALTKGADVKRTKWYVSFDLNYDMNSFSPNYTMLMLTDNREGDLPYLERVQGYEYDYVQVAEGSIVEWRKFGLETDREIVFNDTYQSFADYVNAGLTYNADTCKWYKNNNLNKITRMDDTKKATIAEAFADGLGLNSTDIKSAAFWAKEGTRHGAITEYYNQISTMMEDELIYDLVCKKEDKEREDKNWPQSFLERKEINNFVPSFAEVNASAKYSVSFQTDMGQECAVVTISGATERDFEAYGAKLEEIGYEKSIEGGYVNYHIFLDLTGSSVVVIGFKDNDILITRMDDNGNGGGGSSGGESNDPIGITYAADFTGAYEDYDKIQIDQGSVATMIETISGGAVTEKSIVTYVSGAGIHYEIALKAEDGKTAEQTAEKAEKDYLDALGDMPVFAQGMPVRYCTLADGSNDIVVVVVGDVANGKPVLHIYVFVFTANSVREIAGAAQGTNGGGQQGTNGGGQQGGNESGNGGKEEGGSGNEGGQSGEESYIMVRAYDVGEDGTLTEYTSRPYSADERIEAWGFGDGWLLYTDEACTQPIDLNEPIYAKGTDVNLYRKIERDFVSVKFIRFYNDAYCSGFLGKKTVVCRKGRIYEGLLGSENSDFGNAVSVFADIDKTQVVNANDRCAFTENVTYYVFAENQNYRAYDIVGNGQTIMRVALTDGADVAATNETEFHSADGRHIKATVDEVKGDVVYVSDVQKEFIFAQCYAFNGREMYREEWYFTADQGWGWAPAENVNWYTDASLSANVTYGDKITGNASVWKAYDERSLRPNLEND